MKASFDKTSCGVPPIRLKLNPKIGVGELVKWRMPTRQLRRGTRRGMTVPRARSGCRSRWIARASSRRGRVLAAML